MGLGDAGFHQHPRVALERGRGAPSPRRTPAQRPKPSCWEPFLAPTAPPWVTPADLGTEAVLDSCVYRCSEDAAAMVFWKFLSPTRLERVQQRARLILFSDFQPLARWLSLK